VTDQSADTKVRRAKGSVKEAIGKITGDDTTIAEGTAEKKAARASGQERC